ncbi:ExbD/TolR family protein [Dyella jiangningensis]|jgi:biopolymer transport protein ExbD|uniref:Biopolymer transporter ExbD n=1 Tax=Dyella jiangningensis TaxID=1379159 RepID=A0A023NWQ2_9GAMM|nr:biopolymer transporter ExbD [Dyella jiangningensis]AHX15306.1 biopolymer transporter ExbD [Dyella jiangningensis]MDG2539716.1 biopolymer transporter ExbD [Dyella jiangningensis]RAO76373.1 biopolymer transporter ExbD [Dyella jiangningensis]
MAMSTGDNSGGPMSEINVTPLVDVMLVLLIIFMITAPLMSHRITVDLPTANPKVSDNEPVEPMDLAVKPDGTLYLSDVEVTEGELKAQFAVAASKSPQPELQIRADKTTEYKVVKKVLADAKEAGMVHVGFITTGKE